MLKTLRPDSTINIPDNPLEEKKHVKPNRNGKTKFSFIKEYLADFLTNSNLHGLKYIGEKERTYVEKFFWLCVFICSVFLCARLIKDTWFKWNISPVIVTFAEKTTPIYEIPYPAVTICLETKAAQRRYNFTKYYHMNRDKELYNNLTEEERNLFEDVSLVCDHKLAPHDGRKIVNATQTISNIRQVGPNKTEALFGCKWQDIASDNCSHLIYSILTEEGQCYTFNTLTSEELFRTENLHSDYSYFDQETKRSQWTLDDGYPPDTPVETYPHRGAGFGVKSGLSYLMMLNTYDQDYICKGPVQGVKVLLHNPAEFPRPSQQYFRVPAENEVVISVIPKMITTSEGLKPYDPKRRHCYFTSERYLMYFQTYTQANCETECLVNFTYARCGCAHFGMPHGQNMSVCGTGSLACMKRAQLELLSIEAQSAMDYKVWDVDALNTVRDVAEQCQCLPGCTSIEYEAETSQAYYEGIRSIQAYRIVIPVQMINTSYTRALIYFKAAEFIMYRRSELYGITDFIANCGGLLGLFLGFSFMSVVEIIYFLTLRPYCLFRQQLNVQTLKSPKKSLTTPN